MLIHSWGTSHTPPSHRFAAPHASGWCHSGTAAPDSVQRTGAPPAAHQNPRHDNPTSVLPAHPA